MNSRVHKRVAQFNLDLNLAASQNLHGSAGLPNTKLKLYSAETIFKVPALEQTFKGYFAENPLRKVIDMEDEPIEVEYIYGVHNDVRCILEFDKRARLDLEKRKGDSFKLEDLVMRLDT